MCKPRIVAAVRPAILADGTVERSEQVLADLFAVVAPPTSSNQLVVAQWLNVRTVNLMDLGVASQETEYFGPCSEGFISWILPLKYSTPVLSPPRLPFFKPFHKT